MTQTIVVGFFKDNEKWIYVSPEDICSLYHLQPINRKCVVDSSTPVPIWDQDFV